MEQTHEESKELSWQEALELTRSMIFRDQFEPAEQIFQQMLDAVPGQPDVLNLYALLEVKRNRPEQALALMQQLVEQDPELAGAHNNIGNLLVGMGRIDEAIDAYRKALALQPGMADAWSNLGIQLCRRNQLDEALEANQRACELAPDHIDARHSLANTLMARRDYSQAVALYHSVLDASPEYMPAYLMLTSCLLALNLREEALDVLRRWEKYMPDHPVVEHLNALLTEGAKIPERASDQYVSSVFDGMADHFDQHLSNLDYRTPEKLGHLMSQYIGSQSGLQVLDAGCGTGLCIPWLRPLADQVIGVDLSSGMLKHAEQRGGYDALHEAELVHWLQSHIEHYDLIISSDTLVYFGRLDQMIEAAAQALRSSGWLVFSVEALEEGDERDYVLSISGRYQHNRGYIQRLLKQSGFSLLHFDHDTLRLEGGHPVLGYLVLARLDPVGGG